MDGNEYVELDLEFLHQTDDAVLIQEEKREIWIPKSVCEDPPNFVDNIDRNTSISISVKYWFAEKEGLI